VKISIIIPAFNEEYGIKSCLESIIKEKLNEKYEVIFVNDGSTDNTQSIIESYPVKLINHNVNKGYGAALKAGIRRATGDKIIILDSDGQHDPLDINKMVHLLEENDMIIGERDLSSYQVKNRKTGKNIIRIIGEYLVEQKLPDYNSGFRGFDASFIKSMLHLMPNGFSFSTTSTIAFLKEGYTIGTFPITATKREGRKSSVRFAKDGSKTILLIFRIIMLFNPLKIFFPASVFVTSLGVLWGIYGIILYERFPNTALLLSIFGMFLFFFGLLADQVATLNKKQK